MTKEFVQLRSHSLLRRPRIEHRPPGENADMDTRSRRNNNRISQSRFRTRLTLRGVNANVQYFDDQLTIASYRPHNLMVGFLRLAVVMDPGVVFAGPQDLLQFCSPKPHVVWT